MVKALCFSCKKELSFGSEVGRREECPHCRSDVHVCLNCQFYDRHSYNECRETQADVVKDKERANFCDYFMMGSKLGNPSPSKDDLKAKAEALFKNLSKK